MSAEQGAGRGDLLLKQLLNHSKHLSEIVEMLLPQDTPSVSWGREFPLAGGIQPALRKFRDRDFREPQSEPWKSSLCTPPEGTAVPPRALLLLGSWCMCGHSFIRGQ